MAALIVHGVVSIGSHSLVKQFGGDLDKW